MTLRSCTEGGDLTPVHLTGLEAWLRKHSAGYWLAKDGTVTFALYKPTWWERLIVRIADGERWIPNAP